MLFIHTCLNISCINKLFIEQNKTKQNTIEKLSNTCTLVCVEKDEESKKENVFRKVIFW